MQPLLRELGFNCGLKEHKNPVSILFDVTLGSLGRPRAPQSSSEMPPGGTRRDPRQLPGTIQQQKLPQIQKSTKKDSPRAPKSSVFWRLWRTVSHTFNSFLETSKYAIRSCLCNPNSFPSTPDTPQNELKKSLEHENTNSVAYRFQKFFTTKVNPRNL